MGSELGRLSAHARGTVISGQDIELVLAQIPEQTWDWDEDAVAGEGVVQVDVTVPMAKRREIIGMVLGVMARAGGG
jgi:hypothetical protein